MDYRTFDVPVEGGTLRVGEWGSRGPVVLGSHGMTGNHVSFAPLAEALGDGFRLLVPDHRGRGRSRDVAGPFGVEAHAADLVAVLEHRSIERADVLVGHSMGAFVSAVARARHPDRVARVVFVDGGLPLLERLPEGMTAEQLIRGLLGPGMDRLDMSFASREAYREFWRAHPAVANDWSVWVERYVDYDLFGEPPELRPSPRKDAVFADTESQLVSDVIPRSLESLRGPVRFLRAPRGIRDDAPLYAEERIALWADRIDGFASRTVADVNHYTILLSERGARAVADEVRELSA